MILTRSNINEPRLDDNCYGFAESNVETNDVRWKRDTWTSPAAGGLRSLSKIRSSPLRVKATIPKERHEAAEVNSVDRPRSMISIEDFETVGQRRPVNTSARAAARRRWASLLAAAERLPWDLSRSFRVIVSFIARSTEIRAPFYRPTANFHPRPVSIIPVYI